MQRTMKLLAVTGIVMGGWMGRATAAPLRVEDVSAAAQWVIHLDAERFHQSNLGEGLLAEVLSKEPHASRIASLERLSGVNFRRDILSLTLYGKDARETSGAVVIRGQFANARLLDMIQMNPAYETFSYGTLVIHKWTDNNHDRYGCLYDPRTLVVGASLEGVQAALDVLRGAQPHLAPDSDLLQIAPRRDGILLIAAAQGLKDMPGIQAQAAMLKNTQKAAAVVAETEGALNLDVVLTAETAEAAEQMANVLRGMQAYGLLAKDTMSGLSQLAQAVRIAVEGPRVTLSVSWPVADLLNQIRRARESGQGAQPSAAPTL